jgi:hypothetical protein
MRDLGFIILPEIYNKGNVHLFMDSKTWNKATGAIWSGVDDVINILKSVVQDQCIVEFGETQ